jgi:two-component system, NtrC family, sensor kinase
LRIQVGLKTEIVLQITLLLAAALLLAGVLLLKYTERELLAQAVAHHSEMADILVGALNTSASDDALVEEVRGLLKDLQSSGSLLGWALVDRGGQVARSDKPVESRSVESLRHIVISGEKSVQVNYFSPSIFGLSRVQSYARIAIPLDSRGRSAGALMLHFSLDSVHQRIFNGYRILLIYVVLFGAVFIFFGTVLLNRAVIRPVRVLQESTHRIAAGELAHALPEEGPREVAELARDFNAMIEALCLSRGQTEATIKTLEETILQLRRTRDDLLHAEKMASVGHLAAGMAHEIGNPLGALIGYLSLLRTELPPGPEEEIAGRALNEAERIDRLVRELLDYAAPEKGEDEWLDPACVAREAGEMLIHQGNLKGLSLEKDLVPLPKVRISRHRLLQVLVNLLLNARDAAGTGGQIRISGGASTDFVSLSVADNGGGIDPQSASHIFDPFFTTKSPGKGRGLGLSVCHRIVAEAGGRIEVNSTPGEGSTFTVWMPRGGDHEG